MFFGLKLGFNCAQLTENVDESVRQQVAKFVGCVALVDGAGSRLHVAEDHGVVVHLAAAVLRCVYDQRGDQNAKLKTVFENSAKLRFVICAFYFVPEFRLVEFKCL